MGGWRSLEVVEEEEVVGFMPLGVPRTLRAWPTRIGSRASRASYPGSFPRNLIPGKDRDHRKARRARQSPGRQTRGMTLWAVRHTSIARSVD